MSLNVRRGYKVWTWPWRNLVCESMKNSFDRIKIFEYKFHFLCWRTKKSLYLQKEVKCIVVTGDYRTFNVTINRKLWKYVDCVNLKYCESYTFSFWIFLLLQLLLLLLLLLLLYSSMLSLLLSRTKRQLARWW